MIDRKIYTYPGSNVIRFLGYLLVFALPFLWINFFYGDYFSLRISIYELFVLTFAVVLVLFFYFYGGKHVLKMRIEINDQEIKFATHKCEIISDWGSIHKIVLEKYTTKFTKKSWNKSSMKEKEFAQCINVHTSNGNFIFVHDPTFPAFNLKDIVEQLKTKAVKAKLVYQQNDRYRLPIEILRKNQHH